jgi:hypothetical protein
MIEATFTGRLNRRSRPITLPEDFGGRTTAMAQPGAIAATRGSYFRRHWRGELGLSHSFWANGVAIGFGGMVVVTGFGMEAALLSWWFGLVLIAYFIVIVWLTVGIWRAAGRYAGPRTWKVLARIFAIVAALFGVLYELQVFAKALG